MRKYPSFCFVILFGLILAFGGHGPAEAQQKPGATGSGKAASENLLKNQTSEEIRPDKKGAYDKKTEAENQTKGSVPTEFEKSFIEDLRTINQQEAAYKQNDTNQKSWDSPSVWINIGLLIVGILYTFFAGLQWWTIRRQAITVAETLKAIENQAKIAAEGIIETRKAAEAAKGSADAANDHLTLVSKLERPWLIVTPKTPDFPSNPITKTFWIDVKWSAENVGKSPAFLVQQYIDVVVVRGAIPESPTYPEQLPFPEFVVAQGRAHSGDLSKTITKYEFDGIISGECSVMFYGFVKYYDTLHRVLHQTRFCSYWYKPKPDVSLFFVPVGPNSYIEYT